MKRSSKVNFIVQSGWFHSYSETLIPSVIQLELIIHNDNSVSYHSGIGDHW